MMEKYFARHHGKKSHTAYGAMLKEPFIWIFLSKMWTMEEIELWEFAAFKQMDKKVLDSGYCDC